MEETQPKAREPRTVHIADRCCSECSTPMVWTSLWQGALCVVCEKKEADAESARLAALTARVQRVVKTFHAFAGEDDSVHAPTVKAWLQAALDARD